MLEPSELLTNSVVTPAAWAWATIEATLPPSDLLTYQIHMPWPSNARAAGGAGGDGRGAGLGRGRVQGVGVDVDRPVGARVATVAEQDHDVPEWALLGTVTTSPAAALRRCAAGELLRCARRGARGKATIMPAFSPVP